MFPQPITATPSFFDIIITSKKIYLYFNKFYLKSKV